MVRVIVSWLYMTDGIKYYYFMFVDLIMVFVWCTRCHANKGGFRFRFNELCIMSFMCVWNIFWKLVNVLLCLLRCWFLLNLKNAMYIELEKCHSWRTREPLMAHMYIHGDFMRHEFWLLVSSYRTMKLITQVLCNMNHATGWPDE